MAHDHDELGIRFGNAVYDDDGRELGTIRGFDEHGFYVTLDDGLAELSVEHVRSSPQLGEAELMWRCWQCGEMGRLEGEVPECCPACDSPEEELYYWIED
ncbi:hypothetical protein BRD00_14735 [Halobacteriales archaeon QS_8_69_26]|nr:MAG: hypothetical protein BRD00_14735 [Halobacteriales archaeon QS_8_69_26]